MGKQKKGLTILGIVLVLLLGGRAIVVVLSHQDDRTLIQQALKESIQASKEGRPGGVMDKLSDDIKLNGESEEGNQREIARFIRDSKPEITVQDMNPVVTGNEATITSPVDLTLSMLGIERSRHLKEVTLIFRREEGREWLVIPVSNWKLAEVHVPQSAIADLMSP
ncbi:MAG: hypothetical protein P4L46_14290 [Fimbriimonas sp.]|nr:hypothetical protein [Fimbriimonas sp.]